MTKQQKPTLLLQSREESSKEVKLDDKANTLEESKERRPGLNNNEDGDVHYVDVENR